jgi:hypothetical protein
MSIIKYLSNLPGWRTKRKIVVLESDDWGSFRAPIRNGLKQMQDLGLPLGDKDGIRFNQFDDLASSEDLEFLFEILDGVKDSKGNSAVMTALSLVTNPDFNKIEESNFEDYYYLNLIESLEAQNKSKAWSLWQEGCQNKLFVPEFHGREHLNVAAWMRSLQKNDKVALEGFKHQFWGFRHKGNAVSYQAAFDLEFADDINLQQEIIKDGLALFEQLHGRKASFFVPPNGSLNQHIEKTAADYGIKFMSTPKMYDEPLGKGKVKKHFRYLGKLNKNKQLYLTRNAFFEPSSIRKTDWVDACLKEVETAFEFNKPVTISSHRVNYIGSHNIENRDKGLKELKRLLSEITKKWPEVEFMSSVELGNLICK